MKRYGVILISTALGLGAIVAAGAAASAFGLQGSARSFARLQQQVKPNTTLRPARSLAQLRRVNFVSGCRFSHRNTDDPIVFPGQLGRSHNHTFIDNDTTNAFSTLGSLLDPSSSCRRPGRHGGVLGADARLRSGRRDRTAQRDRLLPAAHALGPAGLPAGLQADRRQLQGDGRAEPAGHLVELRARWGAAAEHNPDLPERRSQGPCSPRPVP